LNGVFSHQVSCSVPFFWTLGTNGSRIFLAAKFHDYCISFSTIFREMTPFSLGLSRPEIRSFRLKDLPESCRVCTKPILRYTRLMASFLR